MDDTLGILQVYDAVVLGVEQAQFIDQGFQSLLFVAVEQRTACDVVHCGNIINTLAYGIDIHHASARKQQSVV